MNRSPLADTKILSVSIVAGPSAGTLLQHVGAINDKRVVILPAGSFSPDGHQALEQIRAISEQGEAEHLVIECDARTPAMAYAALFLSPPFSGIVQLTRLVMAVRPADLVGSLLQGTGDARLGSSCFLAEQLEIANDILFASEKDDSALKLARSIAAALNPGAQVSELTSGTVAGLLGAAAPAPLDFGAALDGAGWRQLIDGEQLPESGESNIKAFAYRARKPFHPERFWKLLQDGLPGVFRAKGFFWLATRMDLVGGLNLGGSELHCAAAGQWWAAQDDQIRAQEMPPRTQKEWREPFGDRRQAIAFIGFDFEPDAFKAQLDACLLTDSEMSSGLESWPVLPDPFPSWSMHSHTHECNHDHDHDHESGDHDCCHH
jgi:G3E family GTPase